MDTARQGSLAAAPSPSPEFLADEMRRLKGHRRVADRWIDQTITIDTQDPASKGNCTEAAVASILGIPLSEVPDFRANGDDSRTFWDAFEDFLSERGFEVIRRDGNFCPDCLYLASGPSPRGVKHMVVMRRGELVHDPHPSRAGISAVEHVWLVVPHDPAALSQGASAPVLNTPHDDLTGE